MSFLNKILPKKEKEKKEKTVEAEEVRIPKETETHGGIVIGGVVKGAHITEKSAGNPEGTYVFKIAPSANKTEVRRAIEKRFDVKVEKVRVINLPGKERRRGRQIGWTSGVKKAIVTLKEGQSIEVQ